MNATINDGLRAIIALGVRLLGLLMTVAQRIRIAEFYRHQRQLRLKYGVNTQTPVVAYGPEVAALIDAAAAKTCRPARFAMTSGSTGTPKRILFTKRRLRQLKLTFTDFFARSCWAFSIKRTSLYVFSSMTPDQSLTSMLLDEERLPSYFSTLQAPYRVQSQASIKDLEASYGATAVRLWILAIANPGVLYSTNPSTISTFLDDLTNDWQSSSKLVRDWYFKPQLFAESVHRMAQRLSARGMTERLAIIARSEKPLSLELCAPAVATYICWTGGYVQSFLKRLATYLPTYRYRLIPMYSMSTETVETTSYIRAQSIAYLPLSAGVLYEFIDEEQQDLAANILQPDELKVGHAYSMVVSDDYGLRRYQTADVFRCEGEASGLPNLNFVRRKDLGYSFTGEKLTEQQVHSAFQTLREDIPELADAFLTCIPSHPAEEPVPHYKLVIVTEKLNGSDITSEQLTQRCDRLFAESNCEYRSKRESGRLGHVRLVQLDKISFIKRVAGSHLAESWETQFKFLPLYRQTWESTLERDDISRGAAKPQRRRGR